MSASAAIAARETTADYFANGPCVSGMNAGKSANKWLDSGVKFLLVFIVGDFRGTLTEPFASGFLQDGRKRNPAMTSGALEIGLELAR